MTNQITRNPGVVLFHANRLAGQNLAGRVSGRGNIVKGGKNGRHILEVRKDNDVVYTLHATKGWRSKREA